VASIIEAERAVPVVRDVDVLVVGGGTAGVPAALAAARLGARTMLVEKFNSFGGAITSGLTITLPACPLVGAIFNELLRRLQDKYNGVATRATDPKFVVLDQELYKYEAILMLEEAGAEMLLNTFAVDAVVESGKVAGVVIENKSGRQAIRAKVTIDCTGDADVAFRSGADTAKVPKEELLPITLMWLGANVDTLGDERDDLGGVATIMHDSEVNVWGGNRPGFDGSDAWDLTEAEIELRKEGVGQWLHRRANSAAWAKSYISFMAPHLGVRETRQLVGQLVVTDEEFQEADFPDSIGTTTSDKQLPYRALVPVERDGLLVAGRCVSVTPEVQHTIRIAPDCAMMGEAAGVAAAIGVSTGVEPRGVDVRALQQQLTKQGVHFGKLAELPKRLR